MFFCELINTVLRSFLLREAVMSGGVTECSEWSKRSKPSGLLSFPLNPSYRTSTFQPL